MFKMKNKLFKIIGLALLLVGQSSVASEPTLMDWYKVMPPNYAQFQSVYGSDLDGTVFSQMLRPSDEQYFSDEPLSSEKIQLGAKLSDEAYYHCMVWGYHRLTLMYGDDDLDEITNQLLQLYQSHKDVYDIYNILLASDRYHFPMTEQKAWQRIQQNRANGYDNRDFHKVVRERISQLKDNQQ